MGIPGAGMPPGAPAGVGPAAAPQPHVNPAFFPASSQAPPATTGPPPVSSAAPGGYVSTAVSRYHEL